jgi:hypothetical protein
VAGVGEGDQPRRVIRARLERYEGRRDQRSRRHHRVRPLSDCTRQRNFSFLLTPSTPAASAPGVSDMAVAAGPISAAVAPEPSTWAMLVVGFAGLGFVGYPAREGGKRSVKAWPESIGPFDRLEMYASAVALLGCPVPGRGALEHSKRALTFLVADRRRRCRTRRRTSVAAACARPWRKVE